MSTTKTIVENKSESWISKLKGNERQKDSIAGTRQKPRALPVYKRGSALKASRRALLVGINHYYLDDAIGNLQFCVNDVVELEKILADATRGDFATQLLRSDVGDKKSEPNRSNILSMVRLLSNNSSQDDSLLIYFACHGFEQDGLNYLLPADARLNVLADTAIRVRWVVESLRRSSAKRKYLIVDACHAGSRLGRSQSLPMTKSLQQDLFVGAEGFAILTSCGLHELSFDWPEKNHGVFSYYLKEALMGLADYDNDYVVTVSDANRYVFEQTRQWAMSRKYQQSPFFQYSGSGDFVFVRVPHGEVIDISERVNSQYEVTSGTTETQQELIAGILEDISLGVSDESAFVEFLNRNIVYNQNAEEKFRLGTLFLRQLASTRVSALSLARGSLMPLISQLIRGDKEFKKWLKGENKVRQFLVSEFVSSGSFDYAGTMAVIMDELLPVLSDEDVIDVLAAIEKNAQIRGSFRARKYLISILSSCRDMLSAEEYRKMLTELE